MNDLFSLSEQFQLSWPAWATAFAVTFLIGLSKGGVKGMGVFIVTMMAFIFGGKASTGIVLILFMLGDIMAVSYYRRDTQWKYLRQLLPAMMVGVLVGVWIGKDLPELLFKRAMAIIILFSILLLFYWEKYPPKEVPDNPLFARFMGFLAGFTTMIGNLAGPLASIYFLAIRLPKAQFIGTAAWLFFIINIFKFPFHIFVWETVTIETLALNLRLIPSTVLGFVAGVFLVKYIKEQQYRYLILFLTAIGALVLLIR